jgi:hypothetical protein
VVDPLRLVFHDYRIVPLHIVFLTPFAWVGVTALGRGEWVRAYGAWVLLFGQFFELVYNGVHSSSSIGLLLGGFIGD